MGQSQSNDSCMDEEKASSTTYFTLDSISSAKSCSTSSSSNTPNNCKCLDADQVNAPWQPGTWISREVEGSFFGRHHGIAISDGYVIEATRDTDCKDSQKSGIAIISDITVSFCSSSFLLIV